MREWFKDHAFHADTAELVSKCLKVIASYQAMGLRLTLRQLYYQLVSANFIPNEEKSYKNLGTAVSRARLAGIIDWAAIEDRGRVADTPREYSDIAELVAAAIYSYRLPRWAGQYAYVELWVEKQALAGVLEPIASKYHVTLMVNKGYSSQSAMYESSKRFLRVQEENEEIECHLLYLGDHDPSGEDMVRDIADRLEIFGVQRLNVKKVALTYNQILEFNPPPNPTKLTDSRAKKYIEKFGRESWEVDALPPNVLTSLISSEIEKLVDQDEVDMIKEKEERDKDLLRKAAAAILRGDVGQD